MNFPVGCEKEEPFESRQVLCDACNTNQQVKVYLMGNFEASSEVCLRYKNRKSLSHQFIFEFGNRLFHFLVTKCLSLASKPGKPLWSTITCITSWETLKPAARYVLDPKNRKSLSHQFIFEFGNRLFHFLVTKCLSLASKPGKPLWSTITCITSWETLKPAARYVLDPKNRKSLSHQFIFKFGNQFILLIQETIYSYCLTGLP